MSIALFESISMSIFNVAIFYLLISMVVVFVRERFPDKHRIQRLIYNLSIWFVDGLIIILLNGGEVATAELLLPVIKFIS